MTYKEFIECIEIFAKYSKEGLDSYAAISAEHDEFWMGVDPEKVSEEDNKRLEELGWIESWEGGAYHRFT